MLRRCIVCPVVAAFAPVLAAEAGDRPDEDGVTDLFQAGMVFKGSGSGCCGNQNDRIFGFLRGHFDFRCDFIAHGGATRS